MSISTSPSSTFTPPVTIQPLPKLVNSRIEWYHNGDPAPKGKTQYGLLLDVDYSKFRYNINFFDGHEGVSFVQTGIKNEEFNEDDQQVIFRLFNMYKMLHIHLDVSMAHGKLNVLSGAKHPTTGKPLYKFVDEFRIWALIVRNTFTPTCFLFYGDETLYLSSYGWNKPQSSTNKQMKWVHKI